MKFSFKIGTFKRHKVDSLLFCAAKILGMQKRFIQQIDEQSASEPVQKKEVKRINKQY